MDSPVIRTTTKYDIVSETLKKIDLFYTAKSRREAAGAILILMNPACPFLTPEIVKVLNKNSAYADLLESPMYLVICRETISQFDPAFAQVFEDHLDTKL